MLSLLLALSIDAQAAVPRIVGTPVVTNPTFNGLANTMMYDVTVTVSNTGADALHVSKVGFASEDDYTGCLRTTAWKWSHTETFDTTDTQTWTLYNFVPGKTYYYKVVVGSGPMARTRCGTLATTAAPTPTLPTNLANLPVQYDLPAARPADTNYVLIETDDCGATDTSYANARDYLVVFDPFAETIVWYLDISAVSGVRGATSGAVRYQPGPTATSGRILLSIERRYLHAWGFDGSSLAFRDFDDDDQCSAVAGSTGPCPHHDVFQSDDSGLTYVSASTISATDSMDTAWEDACGADADFIDDGYVVLDDAFEETGHGSLMADHGYDPRVNGGPNADELARRPFACAADTWTRTFDQTRGTIDWTHVNSITASSYGPGEVIDISLREWSQVVRINAATGNMLWRLSSRAELSDWSPIDLAAGVVGDADFVSQHDVHAIGAGLLMMFDNLGDAAGSRVIQIFLDPDTDGATIEKAWAMVDANGDPMRCLFEGTGMLVPDSANEHAFAICKDDYVIAELDDPTGNSGTPPPLSIWLPDGSATEGPFCASGGPTDRNRIRGWHRAFPLATVGEF